MKIEPRGKYAGVKIHLDANETKILLDSQDSCEVNEFIFEMRQELRMLYEEHGDHLLKDKTKEEIAAAHKSELHKASKGLKKLKAQGVIV